MNVHKGVGDLLAHIASAIQNGRPISPKLAKYALDILEGRFVPLAKNTNACATGFPEVVDVAFGPSGIPTWIARDKDGNAFAFRGFGPDGGPGELVETPKNWHIELVHGIENDVPIVAWPKENPRVFDIRWNEHHRFIGGVVNLTQDRPAFVLWKDDEDRRFAAVFGPHDGQLICIDDQLLDRHFEFGMHQCVTEVMERGGRVWIIAFNERRAEYEMIDDRGESIGTGSEHSMDIAVHDGKPMLVTIRKPNVIMVGNRTILDAYAYPPYQNVARNHVVNRGRDVVVYNNALRNGIGGLYDAITGVEFAHFSFLSNYTIAATDNRLFVVNNSGEFNIRDREDGGYLASENGVRAHDPFLQFGDDMCVAFEKGNWHVYYGADDTEWDTGIPSSEHIQLLPGHRAATWKFVDGTLYTRVVKSAD